GHDREGVRGLWDGAVRRAVRSPLARRRQPRLFGTTRTDTVALSDRSLPRMRFGLFQSVLLARRNPAAVPRSRLYSGAAATEHGAGLLCGAGEVAAELIQGCAHSRGRLWQRLF